MLAIIIIRRKHTYEKAKKRHIREDTNPETVKQRIDNKLELDYKQPLLLGRIIHNCR